VLAYRLDGALVSGPIRHPDLVETAMFVEELVVVTARWVVDLDTALLAPGGPRVLVFRAGCSYRARLSQALAARGAAGVRLLEYGTLEGILGCVGAGLGVSLLLPRAVVERHLADGRVRAHVLTEQESHAETIFVRRRDVRSSPALTRFVEHVHQAGQPAVLQVVGGGHSTSS
jgi:DNA-binding transcriptional LysR family regulator